MSYKMCGHMHINVAIHKAYSHSYNNAWHHYYRYNKWLVYSYSVNDNSHIVIFITTKGSMVIPVNPPMANAATSFL